MAHSHLSIPFEEASALKKWVTCNADFADRISILLALQLQILRSKSGDDSSVLFEIRHLERGVKTTTKAASQFKHPPLFPLWHKHFSTGNNFWRNVGERWNTARGNGNKDLQKMTKEVSAEHGDNVNKWAGSIAYKFIFEGLIERTQSGRITGDWIIFAEHEGLRYYLSLARHEDGSSEEVASLLRQKIETSCSIDFPFLFQPK